MSLKSYTYVSKLGKYLDSVKSTQDLVRLVYATPIAMTCLDMTQLATSRLTFIPRIAPNAGILPEEIQKWLDIIKFDTLMPEALATTLLYGYTPYEILWGFAGGKITPVDANQIHPSTIEKIDFIDGKPDVFSQKPPTGKTTKGKPAIKADMCQIFTYPASRSMPLGMSIFQAVDKELQCLDILLPLIPHAAQKAFLGATDIKAIEAGLSEEEKDKIETDMQAIIDSFDEKGGVTVGHSENLEIEFKALEAKLDPLVNIYASIEQRIARRFNALGLFQGRGTVFDDKSVDAEQFRLWVKGVADSLCVAFSEQTISKYLAFNGLPQGSAWLECQWPETKGSTEAISQLGNPVVALVNGGLLPPTKALSDFIAQTGGLPTATEEEWDQYQADRKATQVKAERQLMMSRLDFVNYNAIQRRFEGTESQIMTATSTWYDRTKEVAWSKLKKACEEKSGPAVRDWKPALAGLDVAIYGAVDQQYKDAIDAAQKEAGIEVNISPVGLQEVHTRIRQDLFNNLLPDLNNAVSLKLLNAFMGQYTPEQYHLMIVEAIEKEKQKWLAKVTIYASWAENKGRYDVSQSTDVVGFIWDSWLDGETTEGCKWAAGRFMSKLSRWYGVLVPGYVHYNCRAVMIPVTASKQAQYKFQDGFDAIPKYVKDSWSLVSWA